MRTFFIECSGGHWLRIAQKLSADCEVVPILWSADAQTLDKVTAAFRGIVTVVGVDAACGELPAASRWKQRPLDEPLLRAQASDEAIGLAMMDRMEGRPGDFPHDARRRHWHDLLRQWNAALDELSPELVVFAMAPHAIYDYALYTLCRIRGIPTRMFERTALPGLVYLLSRFEEGSAELRAVLKSPDASGQPIRIGDSGREHVARLREGGGKALPPNYRKKLAARGLLDRSGRQADAGIARFLGFEWKRTLYLLLRLGAAPQNYFVREESSGNLVRPSAIRWVADRWRSQFRKRRLRRQLARISGPVDLQEPYVLLALHYQPERAIIPMAGAFGDQLLIVDMLSRSLPDGWRLVVKEHPWQLVPFGRGELGRSAAFYQRLTRYQNVVIANATADTGALLDSARAVATATGSVGWQAIAKGIPALVFGAAWYRDAPGVFPILDGASCRAAMTAIANGNVVPVDAAERMLAAIEAVTVSGYLEPTLEAVDTVGEADVVTAMSALLRRSLSGSPAALAERAC
jgi:hypothetical protein